MGFMVPASQPGGDSNPGEGGPVEDALLGIGSPDDCEDEAVADTQLGEIALVRAAGDGGNRRDL